MKMSKDRGRIKVTIETDVIVMKEFYAMIADLPMAIEKRLPYWKRALTKISEFIDSL